MNILSKFDDGEDLAYRGSEEVARFIKQNYTKFNIVQLCRMLSITPGVIQDILSDDQIKQCGRKGATNVIFIRDMSTYSEDVERFEKR